MKKRLLCLFLTLALTISVLLPTVPTAQAAKQEKTRAIGIVFDNSGSMYEYMYGKDNKKAWCQATYAMEAFASMMNEGDQLIVFPMNGITMGPGSEDNAKTDPLVINGPGESKTIRQIYTPHAGDTPFKTVVAAYNGLKNVKADEKYLIVLTDGRFEEGGIFEEMSHVNATLDEYSKDMNIMFLGLGIDDVYIPTESNSRQHYVKANSSSLVLTELTAMCNMIFGRDELPISGKTASFDVSMSKLIVFIQGEDISNVTLGGKKPVSQHSLKYSELGCGNQGYNWLVDTTLQGAIATFENLDAGNYELSYNGNATSTSIYYEPDVDLAITLTDSMGNPVTSEIYADTYTLKYELVDKYGKPTNSSLLGKVNYNITYSINGQVQEIKDTKSGSVELPLNAGDTLDGDFTVTYLGDYTIHKDSAALGWPADGFTVITRPVGQVIAKVDGGQNVYPLSELEDLAVYEVTLYCEGEQITGEDMDRAELNVEIDGGNAIPDIQKTDNGFTVSLKYNGSAVDTTCGPQSATFRAAYTNVDGQTGNADPVVREFEIQDNSSALDVKIQLEQSYYVISKLDESAPIRFLLTADGAPLSAEQFAAIDFQVDMEGLVFDLQPDPQNSAYIATLQPGQKIDAKKYTVSCVANGYDEIGRPISAEDSAKIECSPYPKWVILLFILLALLLIASIILAIMSKKILPKKILLNDDVVFTVQGKEIPGAATCSFVGGNKKKGSLRIQSPPYIPNPLAQCGLSMALEAVSPRSTKSRSRAAMVTRLTAQNPATTSSITVGGFQMEKDPKTGNLVPVGAEDGTAINFKIANNIDFEVVAKVPNSSGRTVTCTLSGTLRFM